jgi:hypothetical protein
MNFNAVLDDVLDVERSFWTSSGDQDFYRSHVADEGLFVLSMGVMDKAAVIEAMGPAEPWDSFEIQEPSLVSISDGVVGLVYQAGGQRTAQSDEYRARILSVYRETDRDWELILHQQTPLES